MCASFAPPKPPSAFTMGKAGQDSAGASRRRQNSTPRRSRSPSPLSHEPLDSVGGHAFSKEDFATALSAAGSQNGGGSGGYPFTSAAPTLLSTSQTLKARGGYYPDRAGPSTAPTTVPATVPPVSPTGDERPATFRSSSATAAAAAATPAGSGANSPTNVAGGPAKNFAATSPAAPRPVADIPTFSEIAQGAMRAGGDLPLEPFARMRIRAAEEGWAREEAERQEREKRRRVKVLSGVTLLVLVVVLACRCIGVGIVINGPAGAAPPPPGKNRANRPPSDNAPPQSFLSAAASEMPAIASSKDEFIAALKLAGLKKPKPAQVDRAWSALASGENRSSSSSSSSSDPAGGGSGAAGMYYVRGGMLAANVVAAAVLRNPDFVAILALALATLVLVPRIQPSWGWRSASGKRCGDDDGRAAARGGSEATNNGNGSPRAAGLLRPGSRGAGGVAAANGHAWNGVVTRSGAGGRGVSSSLSPRRLVGS